MLPFSKVLGTQKASQHTNESNSNAQTTQPNASHLLPMQRRFTSFFSAMMRALYDLSIMWRCGHGAPTAMNADYWSL